MLAEAGIECERAARRGEAALEAARDPRVGVVVLDVRSPDMSGIEVLRRLRSERPTLRVIMLSAHTDQELVLEALRLGACDYLAKPLHDEELVLAVRRALAGFDVESRWQRLRDRLRRLESAIGPGRAPEAAEERASRGRPARLRSAVGEAVADVLDAGKTSLMLLDEEAGELRVAAATGASLEVERDGSGGAGRGRGRRGRCRWARR